MRCRCRRPFRSWQVRSARCDHRTPPSRSRREKHAPCVACLMQYSRMRQEFEAGPVVVRLDFLLVIAGAAIIASPILAICLAAAVTLHELGHAAAARWLGREPFRLLIQLAGGR